MKQLSVEHLLGIKYLKNTDIDLIFETADQFKEVINRPIKKGFNPTCFIEISTLIIIQKITINKKAIKNLTANRSII